MPRSASALATATTAMFLFLIIIVGLPGFSGRAQAANATLGVNMV